MTKTSTPWIGIQSQFLADRPAVDQVHIFDLSARAAQALHRWAARYPLIRRVRVWPLALSVAAAAPHSSVEALISTARLSLWVFTLDDLFDEERVPAGELVQRADRYRAIAYDQPTSPTRDSMATALREVREDLAKYPLFDPLGTAWGDALCGTIDGMLREYEWRHQYRLIGPAALPTYAEYVAAGLYSIGGPPHIWAALITTGDVSTPRHLDHLRAMEQHAATCIRLANDLRSHAKEMAEGKINALVLLGHNFQLQGITEATACELAKKQVSSEIEAGLKALTALQALKGTTTGRPEATIADIARFVCDFYTMHDYHTFTGNGKGDIGSVAV